MLLFLFLHHLFLHNAWIPESTYYSENYAGINSPHVYNTIGGVPRFRYTGGSTVLAYMHNFSGDHCLDGILY